MRYRELETSVAQDAVLSEIWSLRGPGVALLDLDGCLFDTRWRQMAIFAAYAEQTGRYELARVRPHHFVGRDLRATLASAGIDLGGAYSAFEAFWLARFFDEVELDHPLPGAVRCVRRLVSAGLQIVYLTGRHAGVSDRTRRGLIRYGFPWEGTDLVEKADSSTPDHAHKSAALARWTNVALALENEPSQLEEMARVFPGCVPVLVETDHSGRPANLPARTRRIRGFLTTADGSADRLANHQP
jgi:hypothetical protein